MSEDKTVDPVETECQKPVPTAAIATRDRPGSRSTPPSEFRLEDDGVYRRVENREGEFEWQWLCSRVRVVAFTRSTEGEEWGRLIEVVDPEGRVHEWAMPMTMFAGDGTCYREELLRLGMVIAPGNAARQALHRYLSTKPDAYAICVDRVGWHEDRYVTTGGIYGPERSERVILQTAGANLRPIVAGSLDGWKNEVARLAIGNSRLALAISLPFAGPLLYLIGAESGGLHFRGGSSTGKSTAARAAASASGVDLESWRTTDNAAEDTAARHSDGLLVIDELGQAEPRVVDALAYMLGNDRGKARMRRNATARAPKRWRVLFLSTGEVGLPERLSEVNRKARVGQAMRMLEIPAEAGHGHGLFEDVHGFDGGGAFADHLRHATEAHRGHALPHFLEAITRDLEQTKARVRELRDLWLKERGLERVDGQVSRAAARFALIAAAGERATELGILPWPAGEAFRAAEVCFTAWLNSRGTTGPFEIEQGLKQVLAFLEAHGSSRFEITPAPRGGSGEPIDQRIVARAGFRRKDAEDRWEYLVFAEAWRQEVCAGLDASAIARAMANAGDLECDLSEGRVRGKQMRLPGIGKTRVFVVRGGFLDPDRLKPGGTGGTWGPATQNASESRGFGRAPAVPVADSGRGYTGSGSDANELSDSVQHPERDYPVPLVPRHSSSVGTEETLGDQCCTPATPRTPAAAEKATADAQSMDGWLKEVGMLVGAALPEDAVARVRSMDPSEWRAAVEAFSNKIRSGTKPMDAFRAAAGCSESKEVPQQPEPAGADASRPRDDGDYEPSGIGPASITGLETASTPRGWHVYRGEISGTPDGPGEFHVHKGQAGMVFPLRGRPGKYAWVRATAGESEHHEPALQPGPSGPVAE